VAEQGVQQRAEDTPLGGPVLSVSVEEVLLPILTPCGLPIRKSRIQFQRVVSRPRALSIVPSLERTIVFNAKLLSINSILT
jgi:hypothetical protein